MIRLKNYAPKIVSPVVEFDGELMHDSSVTSETQALASSSHDVTLSGDATLWPELRDSMTT